ncbi:MAG: DUF1902 domain-containing protein [Gammaproteobacteria bacterium]
MLNADSKTLQVHAGWDDQAGVWCASSTDIAGLAIEAETKDALVMRLQEIIPELWELNHAGREMAPVELLFGGRQTLALAC